MFNNIDREWLICVRWRHGDSMWVFFCRIRYILILDRNPMCFMWPPKHFFLREGGLSNCIVDLCITQFPAIYFASVCSSNGWVLEHGTTRANSLPMIYYSLCSMLALCGTCMRLMDYHSAYQMHLPNRYRLELIPQSTSTTDQNWFNHYGRPTHCPSHSFFYTGKSLWNYCKCLCLRSFSLLIKCLAGILTLPPLN